MWPGPYGIGGSRKYLLASLDQSLKRMGLDYVDIFYSHRVDPTLRSRRRWARLSIAHRQGKALYVGISSYSPELTRRAHDISRAEGVPLLIHQPSYSMVNRWIEHGLLDTLGELGIGCIAFSPLAQGMLTSKYLGGVPDDARAARDGSFGERTVYGRKYAAHPLVERDCRKSADRRWRKWQSPGFCATSRVTSALVGARTSISSRIRWSPSRNSTSPKTNWPGSTGWPQTLGSTSGKHPLRSARQNENVESRPRCSVATLVMRGGTAPDRNHDRRFAGSRALSAGRQCA